MVAFGGPWAVTSDKRLPHEWVLSIGIGIGLAIALALQLVLDRVDHSHGSDGREDNDRRPVAIGRGATAQVGGQ